MIGLLYFLIFINMKYIITESKLEQIIFEYLNSHFNKKTIYKVKIDKDYFFWTSHDDYLNSSGLLFSYYSKRDELGISQKLKNEIEGMFGVDGWYCSQIISKWFESTFEFDVENYYII